MPPATPGGLKRRQPRWRLAVRENGLLLRASRFLDHLFKVEPVLFMNKQL
jgi:hypothetical protein